MVGRRSLDRLIVIGIIGIAVWVVIVGRLFAVQIVSSNYWKTKASYQQRKVETIRAARGEIYGRNGEVLAKNTVAYDFWTTKSSIKNIDKVDSMFAEVVGFERGYIGRRIESTRLNWLYLARKVDLNSALALKELEKDSVFSTPVYNRIYPYGRTAGQILGFVDVDGKGREGLELRYDSYLKGQNGQRTIISDAHGRPYRVYQLDGKPAIPGAHIHLTIHPELQQIVEAELAEGVERYKADNAMAIFIKPSTGEILAMACYPDYDPNNPGRADLFARRLRQVTDIYEPGSTFKLVTFSALLENNAIALEETVDCENGRWFFCNDTIRDATPHRNLSARKVFIHSSNIGTIKLSLRLEPEVLYSYARAFGFGSPTGIDLPGEVVGILHRPENWSGMTPAAFPMGHEVAVTAMQIASAYGAVANGGVLMQPYFVKSVVDPSGRVIRDREPIRVRRVIDEETAEILCELMHAVVDSGTGVRARIPGLPSAGKTGTAQKLEEGGRGYSDTDYISSYAGFAPVESPQIVGVIIYDNPKCQTHWGGWTAAPSWKNIVTKAYATGIITRDIEPTAKTEEEGDFALVPDVRRMSASQAVEILTMRGFEVETSGEGFVVEQAPAGRMVATGSTVRLILRPMENKTGTQVEVPDVKGLTIREAILEMAQSNVKFRIVGSGVVMAQDPKPGKFINRDDICLLKCEIKKSN
ncbi:MAG TPA: PASTA domain-containing protein [candidate division Zixibacteria bacterium]|nr:PASTA domain-containing protein [candidate division Zixibacteria bacterium]